jgi:hypothetical protein
MPKKMKDCDKKDCKKGKKRNLPPWLKKKGKKNEKEEMVKESVDVTHIRNFIGNLCDKNFSEAGKCLKLAIREKTKDYIESIGKEKV